MKRDWLFCRLSGAPWSEGGQRTAAPPPPLISRLVRRMRRTDPDCRWFFHRLHGRTGSELGLWFNSAPEILRTVAEELRIQPSTPDLELAGPTQRPARLPRSGDRDVVDHLATLSSDFALDMLGLGMPQPDAQFPLAVAHLRGLIELVPPGQRAPFLFQCWQHWSAEVPGDERVTLVRRAQSPSYTYTSPDPADGHAARIRERYLRSLHDVLCDERRQDGVPTNYLLFEHAHHTHHRLGVPPVVESLAALVVRIEQRPGQATSGTVNDEARRVRSA